MPSKQDQKVGDRQVVRCACYHKPDGSLHARQKKTKTALYKGKRGGIYYLTPSGRKQYVK